MSLVANNRVVDVQSEWDVRREATTDFLIRMLCRTA